MTELINTPQGTQRTLVGKLEARSEDSSPAGKRRTLTIHSIKPIRNEKDFAEVLFNKKEEVKMNIIDKLEARSEDSFPAGKRATSEGGNMQEIETKILGILSVEQCRRHLTKEEQMQFDYLNNKYRVDGRLLPGSFYIGSDSTWKMV